MKTCTKCGIEKDEREFKKDKKNKSGYGSFCKICHNKQCVIYNSNSEIYKLKQKKYMIEYRKTENYKMSCIKSRSTEKYKIRACQYEKSDKCINRRKIYRKTIYKEKNRINSIKYYYSEKGILTNKLYSQSDEFILSQIKYKLKKQIGETPPPELVEVKLLIIKTKRLCKTLKS